jgi:hypothetical protein
MPHYGGAAEFPSRGNYQARRPPAWSLSPANLYKLNAAMAKQTVATLFPRVGPMKKYL